MEYIDIFDENNTPIGEKKEKQQANEEEYKYIRIEDIAGELRDGGKGVGGIGAKGKKNIIVL